MSLIPIIAGIFAALILIILFLWASFVSASPGEIKVISGPRGQRVLEGPAPGARGFHDGFDDLR